MIFTCFIPSKALPHDKDDLSYLGKSNCCAPVNVLEVLDSSGLLSFCTTSGSSRLLLLCRLPPRLLHKFAVEVGFDS